ncbi:response regulator [Ferviditalea candida]|uniref:Response regulator n=1 Tax=Ferviditalea candida TaxID=3108399 RepID=A0ABU5ZGT1_9BACL|nr:response regulator [Paenibacillaceae bacterium T2]
MSSYRILVVDDTHFMRKMAADYLKQNEYEVVGEASNGKEAVKLYEELRPDIVMMDLTMPVMNGLDATKEILKMDPEAVVLVCSASNQQAMIFDALDIGAKGYLTKPFNPERMKEIIGKYAEPFLRTEAAAVQTSSGETESGPEAGDKESITGDEGSTDKDEGPIEKDKGSKAEDNRFEADGEDDEVGAKEIPAAISMEAEPLADTAEKIEDPMVRAAVEMKDGNKMSAGRNGFMRSFVTSYMCNWQEEINGKVSNFAATCTENENRILIEMSGGGSEKQSIQFTLDGFHQLHTWVEGHLMNKMPNK